MFNVTVLRLKDLTKLMIGIMLVSVIILFVSKEMKIGKSKESIENTGNLVNNEELANSNSIIRKIGEGIHYFIAKNNVEAINQTIPVISNINEEYGKIAEEDDIKDEVRKKDYKILKKMLGIQISSINGIENINKNEEENKVANNNENTNGENGEEKDKENNLKNNSEALEPGTKTEIVTKDPIKDGGNTQLGNVKIKNETNYGLTEDLYTSEIQIENKNIVLFHTHSCESYTSSEKYPYTPTGNYRTTDLNFTVTRVGTELETYLKKYNYNVVHNTDYHDYPAYNGSYTRSLKTVENILKTTPSDIIIDVHRDAIGSRSDYAPTVKIGDEEAAQLMFVIGTDAGGLWHPNWRENLKFAIKIQSKAEEMYPGLFKTMMLTTSRYNQHTGKYASIIEVGATGNTLEQCLTSMKYLAKVMNEVIK